MHRLNNRLLITLLLNLSCSTEVFDQQDGGCLQINITLECIDAGQPMVPDCQLCPGSTFESTVCDSGKCVTNCFCGNFYVLFPHDPEMTELDCFKKRDFWFNTTPCREGK